MAKEAYYFSHDSNARQDEKILALRMRHGWEGYGIFWALVEKLREASSYSLKKDYNVISFDLRTDASKIKSIVEDFGLFTFSDDGKSFYSGRMIKNMEQRSDAARKAANARWAKSETTGSQQVNASEMQTHSERNADGMRKDAIKGKERKGKKNKEDIEGEDAGKPAPKPKNLLDDRRKKFYKDLADRVPEYGKSMIRAFYDYWSEPNKSRTKMKWEMERTWDLNLRLKTWRDRDDKWSKPSNVKPLTPAKEAPTLKML